jgi:hypothetical protein
MADNKGKVSTAESKKPKGSYPPRLTLAEAGEIITALYERTGSSATFDELSEILGNTTKSSAFHAKLVCLRKFGLVGVGPGNSVRLSMKANSIVAPQEKAERAEALKDVFLTTEEFRKVYDKFVGKILPEDQFLQNSFLEYGGKDLAPRWMEGFKASLDYAGLLFDRGDGKLQVREMGRADARAVDAAQDEIEPKTALVETALDRVVRMSEPTQAAKSEYQFLIDILAADMSKDEQAAVWTLIQYLKKRDAGQSGDSEE